MNREKVVNTVSVPPEADNKIIILMNITNVKSGKTVKRLVV